MKVEEFSQLRVGQFVEFISGLRFMITERIEREDAHPFFRGVYVTSFLDVAVVREFPVVRIENPDNWKLIEN